MPLVFVLVLVLAYLITGALIAGGCRRASTDHEFREDSPWARRPLPTMTEVEWALPEHERALQPSAGGRV